MQPGPFSSVLAVASLLVASFFGGAYINPIGPPVADNQSLVLSAPAPRPLRRRRRSEPVAAPPPPPPRGRRKRRRGPRVPLKEPAQLTSVLAAIGCVTVVAAAAAAAGSAAACWALRSRGALATAVLPDLAPSLGNDGRQSPPSSPPRRRPVAVPVVVGTFGDPDLLASLARREVRQ